MNMLNKYALDGLRYHGITAAQAVSLGSTLLEGSGGEQAREGGHAWLRREPCHICPA
jgi:hypothetical protein